MSKETIEEAATRLANDHCNIRITPHTTEFQVQQLIIKGAAWQAKRMYSEEEVLQMVDNYRHHFELYRNIQVLPDMFFEWFDKTRKQKS